MQLAEFLTLVILYWGFIPYMSLICFDLSKGYSIISSSEVLLLNLLDSLGCLFEFDKIIFLSKFLLSLIFSLLSSVKSVILLLLLSELILLCFSNG